MRDVARGGRPAAAFAREPRETLAEQWAVGVTMEWPIEDGAERARARPTTWAPFMQLATAARLSTARSG